MGCISAATVAGFTEARARAAQSRASAEAGARARDRAEAQQRRLQQRAVEDNWYLDDVPAPADSASSDSEHDGFQMLSVQDVQRASASSSSSNRTLKVVNFIDFGECNVRAPSAAPTARRHCPSADPHPVSWAFGIGTSSSSSSGASASSPAPAASDGMRRSAGFAVPMQSREDVLLDEVALLRQMLADASEEKKIQLSVVHDEVSEKQACINELARRHAESEAMLQTAGAEVEQLRIARSVGAARCSGEAHEAAVAEDGGASQRSVSELEAMLAQSDRRARACERQAAAAMEAAMREAQGLREAHDNSMSALRAEYQEFERRSLQAVGEYEAGRRAAERSLEELRASAAAKEKRQEKELWQAKERLKRWTAPLAAVASIRNEAELVAWERDLRDEVQHALGRLADRRVELRVAAQATPEMGLCKICFDRPASCALLPCRHHAFCIACGKKVVMARRPTCPLCRVPTSGLFETFAS